MNITSIYSMLNEKGQAMLMECARDLLSNKECCKPTQLKIVSTDVVNSKENEKSKDKSYEMDKAVNLANTYKRKKSTWKKLLCR